MEQMKVWDDLFWASKRHHGFDSLFHRADFTNKFAEFQKTELYEKWIKTEEYQIYLKWQND
jgi:hypothetical protein